MTIFLGTHRVDGQVFLAPMAGVTDVAFRRICRKLGASYAVGEMVASQPHLWQSAKSQARFSFDETDAPRAVQLLGADADDLEAAMHFAVEQGAEVVDFNMGCPAKKVCSVACGSALMKDESHCEVLLNRMGTVAQKLGIPITLKCRTGWDDAHKNVVTIAKMAEAAGFAMLTVHGRTREGGYVAPVEYQSIAQAVRAVSIPVVANGDITDGDKARRVLDETGAAAVMIGRAAMGAPWVFREVASTLAGQTVQPFSDAQKAALIWEHGLAHWAFYEEDVAVMTFRKHLALYLRALPEGSRHLGTLLTETTLEGQKQRLADYFASQGWF